MSLGNLVAVVFGLAFGGALLMLSPAKAGMAQITDLLAFIAKRYVAAKPGLGPINLHAMIVSIDQSAHN